jgi:glycerol uptake facilitator-like aquaporin
MFLTFKQLTPVRFALYSLVQTAGAFIGSAVAYLVYNDAINKFDGGTRQVYGTKVKFFNDLTNFGCSKQFLFIF